MDLSIREAKRSEAALLSSIARASKAGWGYPEEMLALWEDQLTVSADYLDGHWAAVAELDAAVIGFAALVRDQTDLELDHLWVLPACQGLGAGTALLDAAVGEGRRLGHHSLTIVSDPNAEAFYLSRGARKAGEVESSPPGRRLPVLEIELGRVGATASGPAAGALPCQATPPPPYLLPKRPCKVESQRTRA